MVFDELWCYDFVFVSRSGGNKYYYYQLYIVGSNIYNDEVMFGIIFLVFFMFNNFNYIFDMEFDDQIIYCWVGISFVMYMGNDKLFCF